MTTIVLVDSDPQQRKQTLSGIQQQTPDAQITELENGFDALFYFDRAEALLTDLIILDLDLPEIDGISLIEILRDQPLTASIPIVVFSNPCSEHDIRRAWHAGCSGFFMKSLEDPFSNPQILSTILNYWLTPHSLAPRELLQDRSRFDLVA